MYSRHKSKSMCHLSCAEVNFGGLEMMNLSSHLSLLVYRKLRCVMACLDQFPGVKVGIFDWCLVPKNLNCGVVWIASTIL